MPNRHWLENLIDEYISSLAGLPDNDKGHAAAEHCTQWIKDKWAQQALTTEDQQYDLIGNLRHTIRQRLGPNHFALKTLGISSKLDVSSEEEDNVPTVAKRQDVVTVMPQVIVSPRAVNALVYRASQLLISNNWADIACGLAVLVGRSHTETMRTGHFEGKSDFSVMFSTAPKHQEGSQGAHSIELPTLCRAEYVLSAITKLRAMALPDTLSKKQFLSRYSKGASISCDRHLSDLMPLIPGNDRRYPDLVHELYLAIANYFYCPPWVSDAEFKSSIRGLGDPRDKDHGLNNKTAPVKSASELGNRNGSYIVEDEKGRRQRGIKLGQRGADVLELFQRPVPSSATQEYHDVRDAEARALEGVAQEQVSGSTPYVIDSQLLNSQRADSKFASDSGLITQNETEPELTTTHKETTMTEENLSKYELVTYSDAFDRAVERGYKGSKREFRVLSTKEPDTVAEKYGVQRDLSISNPAINQPTWRDLQAQTKKTSRKRTKSSKKVSSTSSSPSSTESSMDKVASTTSLLENTESDLEFVRKLSTGIDFLSREVDVARAERDAAQKECDRLKQKIEGSYDDLNQQVADKDAQIESLQAHIESLQSELSTLKKTYQELEPLLKLVGRAQDQFQHIVPDAAEEAEPDEHPAEPEASPTAESNGRAVEEPEVVEKKPKSTRATGTKAKTTARKTGGRAKSPRATKAKQTAPTTTRKSTKSTKGDRSLNGKATKSSTAKKQSARSQKTDNLDPAVMSALDAIMEYNNKPGRDFEEKWAISYPVMKELLTQVGASTQTKIQAVFNARSHEIEQHMKKHNLGKRHNRNHQGKRISDVLTLKPQR